MDILPSIEDAIALAEAGLASHRAGAHGGDAGFHDCAACGVLERRLASLVQHRERGGRFIPVKGLRVDPGTGEMSVLRVDGTVGGPDEAAARIAAALRRYGLPDGAWTLPDGQSG